MHLRAALSSSSAVFPWPWRASVSCASPYFQLPPSHSHLTITEWPTPGTGASSFVSLFPSVSTGPEWAEGNSRSTRVLSVTSLVVVQLLSLVCFSATTDCSTPGFPVLHCLPYFAQTHGHRVDDAIQPSHPLLPPSPSCPQSFPASGCILMSWLFASGGQSIGVSASVLDWRSYLKIRSVQKKIYLRDEEREREGGIQSLENIDWAAGSNCTWNHMLDFSLMSASKFLADSLGFLFVCFACLIDLLLSIKRILTIIELIHLPLIHQTVLKYSSVSGTGLCFLELQSRERGYTQSKPAEVINSIFVRLWACHRQLGHIILHEPPACFNF